MSAERSERLCLVRLYDLAGSIPGCLEECLDARWPSILIDYLVQCVQVMPSDSERETESRNCGGLWALLSFDSSISFVVLISSQGSDRSTALEYLQCTERCGRITKRLYPAYQASLVAYKTEDK